MSCYSILSLNNSITLTDKFLRQVKMSHLYATYAISDNNFELTPIPIEHIHKVIQTKVK